MKDVSFMKAGLAALAVTVLLSAAPANAQTQVTRIDIPFVFGAGNEMLPAGQYEMVLDRFPRILLRNTTGKTFHSIALSAVWGKRSSADVSPATLRFERYAGTMFLTAAWAPGQEDGRTVLPSGRQAEAMRASLNESHPAPVMIDASLK